MYLTSYAKTEYYDKNIITFDLTERYFYRKINRRGADSSYSDSNVRQIIKLNQTMLFC